MQLEHRLLALLQLHLHSPLNTWLQYIAQRQLQAKMRNIQVVRFGKSYIRDLTVLAGIWTKPIPYWSNTFIIHLWGSENAIIMPWWIKQSLKQSSWYKPSWKFHLWIQLHFGLQDCGWKATNENFLNLPHYVAAFSKLWLWDSSISYT